MAGAAVPVAFPRANVYLGTTTVGEYPTHTGFAWYAGHDADHARHNAQDGDRLETWGWLANDGAGFGLANVTDWRHAIEGTSRYLIDADTPVDWDPAAPGATSPPHTQRMALTGTAPPVEGVGGVPVSTLFYASVRGPRSFLLPLHPPAAAAAAVDAAGEVQEVALGALGGRAVVAVGRDGSGQAVAFVAIPEPAARDETASVSAPPSAVVLSGSADRAWEHVRRALERLGAAQATRAAALSQAVSRCPKPVRARCRTAPKAVSDVLPLESSVSAAEVAASLDDEVLLGEQGPLTTSQSVLVQSRATAASWGIRSTVLVGLDQMPAAARGLWDGASEEAALEAAAERCGAPQWACGQTSTDLQQQARAALVAHAAAALFGGEGPRPGAAGAGDLAGFDAAVASRRAAFEARVDAFLADRAGNDPLAGSLLAAMSQRATELEAELAAADDDERAAPWAADAWRRRTGSLEGRRSWWDSLPSGWQPDRRAVRRGRRFDPSPNGLARFAVANLLGSISFYRGTQIRDAFSDPEQKSSYQRGDPLKSEQLHRMLQAGQVDRSQAETLAGPFSLVSGCPSRSFFPRGFLWDEGFHLLISSAFHPDLAAVSLRSWLSQMDDRGWIAREQILGPEATDAVPHAFRAQHQDIANPPSMLLGAQAVIEQVALADGARAVGGDFVATVKQSPRATRLAAWVLPRFVRHLRWILRTQAGGEDGSFRWRGTRAMDANHTYASGLDDFPRGLYHTEFDQHADLLAWVAMASRRCAELSQVAGDTAAAAAAVRPSGPAGQATVLPFGADSASALTAQLQKLASDAVQRLSRVHFDERRGLFGDRVIAKPLKVMPTASSPELVAHNGYVGVMPLILGVLDPESDTTLAQIRQLRGLSPGSPSAAAAELDATVEAVQRELAEARGAGSAVDGALALGLRGRLAGSRGMLSSFGLRSLSPEDPLWRTADDYWRGKVWVNLNFLALGSLRRIAESGGRHAAEAAATEAQLRAALAATIHEEWVRTGSVWENYDPETGVGTGTQPFTGWSALVVRVIAGMY